MPPRPDRAKVDLSLAEARAIALRAQGFGREPAQQGRHQPADVVQELGAIQIDAVNVLTRAHYLPIFSRIGSYDRAGLDGLLARPAAAFEYMAHAACVVSTDLYDALRWRMDAHRSNKYWLASQRAIAARSPGYLDQVLEEVRERGPLSFQQLSDQGRNERPKTKYADSSILWWPTRPSDGKEILEGLWREGRLAVCARSPAFERIFDLAERVLPPAVMRRPALSPEDGQRKLVAHAGRALGVGWARDFASYFQLSAAATKARLAELVDAGRLQPVRIEGIEETAFIDPGADHRPITSATATLVGPFDSLLWERTRNTRLLGFRHSFEIYLPEKRREFGYYVCPVLMGDRFVGRLDLRAERSSATLMVKAAHSEIDSDPARVADALGESLVELAAWLGLERIEVAKRGDLAPALERAASAKKGVHPSPNIQQHPDVYELENRAADPDGKLETVMWGLAPWSGRTVLDIGCGTGFHLTKFAEKAGAVVGVEPHLPSLSRARARVAHLRNVSVLPGSAESLPLEDAIVDVAHARFAYFFGPDAKPGLDELRRVVKPGGTAFLIDNDPSWGMFAEWLRHSEWANSSDGSPTFWSEEGFTTQSIQSEWRFDSREQLEQVIAIEFPPDLAARILADFTGTTVTYGFLLRHRRY